MYSKNEKSKLSEEFWTNFGKYLSPIKSAEGLTINWVNYKTGVKGIRFFMNVDTNICSIGIRLEHSDLELQQIVFKEFERLKSQFISQIEEPWLWEMLVTENDFIISKIFTKLELVNICNEDDWQKIISFLKPRLIKLDKFWCEFKYNFE